MYTIFFLSCLVLIAVVLLQPGKTDAGALFTSNVSSNAFGPRGTATVLSKITIITAAVFMISALMISMPALSGNVSVLNSAPAEAPVEIPVAGEPSSGAADSNAAANSNGALIETPATEEFKQDAANANANAPAANSAPAANK
ncbi:MAG: preprotein translocase subunit SecG [Pyrinomonadaceae bacterium]